MKENRSQPMPGNRKKQENNESSKERSYRGNNFSGNRNRQYSALPSPSQLEAYEALSEGAASQLLEMAEIEQTHRHEWEEAYLRSYTKSQRIGMLFGFLLAISIVAGSFLLAASGSIIASCALSVSGFSALIVNAIVFFKTRRFERKPIMRHHRKPINKESE